MPRGDFLDLSAVGSGSIDGFYRRRKTPDQPSEEQQRRQEHIRAIGRDGINTLRQLRGLIFSQESAQNTQVLLEQCIELSEQLADFYFQNALGKVSEPEKHPLVKVLATWQKRLDKVEPESKHHAPPQVAGGNLLLASNDMILRTQELVGSIDRPDHRLDKQELISVLEVFLINVNQIYTYMQKGLFRSDTLVAGVLSGGYIEALIAKKVVETFGEPSLALRVFPVAIDKDSQQTAFPAPKNADRTHAVYILDDYIYKGWTIRGVTKALDEVFPQATLYSQDGVNEPERRKLVREKELRQELGNLVSLAVEALEDGRATEAKALAAQAQTLIAQTNFPVATERPQWPKLFQRLQNA